VLHHLATPIRLGLFVGRCVFRFSRSWYQSPCEFRGMPYLSSHEPKRLKNEQLQRSILISNAT
jgi:hypothetical protein